MKPAEFDYLRAASVDEACRALDGAAGDGRLIAGGQTLVPLMAMRLARPSLLVDINHIAELTGIAEHGEVTSVNIITDRDTGRPRGFGFVEMDGADAAIAALDQKV